MQPSGEFLEKTSSANINDNPTLYAFYPHPCFPAISITGDACAFNCKHCGRRYLDGMISCTSPELLFRICSQAAKNGARGVLLSGGHNVDGYVPFEEFLDAIERVKRETGLFISAHTGLVPGWLAKELARAGVDLVDFDLVGDDETIRFTIGADKKTSDYLRAMKILKRFLPELVPHICIGLHGGELKGEFKALEMAAEINPRMLVILVLNPTRGTRFEKATPPSTWEAMRVINRAREELPRTRLALGCMRPKGWRREELESAAFHAGVSRIVTPSRRTLEVAEKSGFRIRTLDACCAVPLGIFGEAREG